MTDILLSDKQVMSLAGPDSKLLIYPDLKKYDSIGELFGNKNKVIILYLNERTGNKLVGHWILLTRIHRAGKTIYEVNDSYGKPIDQPLNWRSKEKNNQLGQGKAYLSKLLLPVCDKNNSEVHYDQMPVQSKASNIATCGRHVGLRAKYYDVPLEEYQSIFKSFKDRGVDLDELVTKVTDKYL